jgi:Protein of unknown function (DUF3618)
MADADGRTPEQVRRDIEAEREQLARAVEQLRADFGEAMDIASKLRANLPVAAAGAVGAGFFLAGGIGATMRYFARRGREGRTRARLGHFQLVDRD